MATGNREQPEVFGSRYMRASMTNRLLSTRSPSHRPPQKKEFCTNTFHRFFQHTGTRYARYISRGCCEYPLEDAQKPLLAILYCVSTNNSSADTGWQRIQWRLDCQTTLAPTAQPRSRMCCARAMNP